MKLNATSVIKVCFYFLFLLFISCKNSELVETSSPYLKVNIQGISYDQGDMPLLTKSTPIKPITKTVSLDDDHYLELSLIEDNNFLTKSSVLEELKENAKFKVLVYDQGKLHSSLEFTYGKNKKNHVKDLKVNRKYVFILYSLGSDVLPQIEGEDQLATLKIKNAEGDLMIFKSEDFLIKEGTTNNLNAILKHKFTKIDLNLNTVEKNKEIKSEGIMTVIPSYKSADYSVIHNKLSYSEPKSPAKFNLEIDTPYKLKGSSLLIHPETNKITLDIKDLVLKDGMTINKTIDFSGNFTPGKKYKLNLSVKDKEIIQELRILSIGSEPYSLVPQGKNSQTKFIESLYNFGDKSYSKVKVKNIRIIPGAQVGITNGLQHALQQSKAQIIVLGGGAYTIRPIGVITLSNFLREGGGVFYATEDATALRRIMDGLEDGIIVDVKKSTNVRYAPIKGIDHPVLNGPFGDIRSKNIGQDNTTNLSLVNGIGSAFHQKYDVLSQLDDGRIFAFAHKKYRLVVVGDGGAIAGKIDNRDATHYPFNVTAAPYYSPIPKENYGRVVSVYNSQFFANAMAWFINGLPKNASK